MSVFKYANMNNLTLLRLVFQILYHLYPLTSNFLLKFPALVIVLYPMPHKPNLYIHRWSYTHTVVYTNSSSYWSLTCQLSFKNEIKFYLLCEPASQKYCSLLPIPSSFHDKMITFIKGWWLAQILFCFAFFYIEKKSVQRVKELPIPSSH